MQGENVWVHVTEEDIVEGDAGCVPCCPASMGIFAAFPADVRSDAVAGAGKLELHRVLNAFQNSPDYGVHVCELFKDPRSYKLDDYWHEVFLEAFSIADLHHVVGGVGTPLSADARARLHQFSRALERLSKRIDWVVVSH